MSDLVYQDDHRTDGIGKLLAQFKDLPRLGAVLGAFMDQVQKLEDVLFELYLDRWIETAEGVQLDVIGRVVGEPRQGIGDDEYRGFLRARVRANRCTGLLDELTQIVALIQGDELPVMARELYPAAIEIEATGEVTANPIRVGRMLKGAKPGGVSLRFVYATAPRTNTLMFDNEINSGELTPEQCFGDGNNDPLTDGGLFAGVYG